MHFHATQEKKTGGRKQYSFFERTMYGCFAQVNMKTGRATSNPSGLYTGEEAVEDQHMRVAVARGAEGVKEED